MCKARLGALINFCLPLFLQPAGHSWVMTYTVTSWILKPADALDILICVFLFMEGRTVSMLEVVEGGAFEASEVATSDAKIQIEIVRCLIRKSQLTHTILSLSAPYRLDPHPSILPLNSASIPSVLP